MKTWLKGGLIGLIISIIPILMSKFLGNMYFMIIYLPIILIINEFTNASGVEAWVGLVYSLILTPIIFFIIGALIGLKIQKRK